MYAVRDKQIGNVYQINWIFIRIFEWKINNDVNIHKSWNKKKIWMEKQTKWFTEQQFSCHKSFEALPTVWRTEVFFRKRNLYQTNQQSLSLKSKEGGEIGLFITVVPKVYNTFFLIRWLNNFGYFYWILIGLFMKLSVQTLPLLIIIYRCYFVHHHLGCI